MKFDAEAVQSVIDNAKFYPYINDQVKGAAKITKPDLRMVKVRLSDSRVASVTLRVTDGLTVCKIRPSFEHGAYRQRRQVESTYAEFASGTPATMFERVVRKIVSVCNRLGVGIASPAASTAAVAETAPEVAEVAETPAAPAPAETVETAEPTETAPEVAPAEPALEFKPHMVYQFCKGEMRYASIARIDGAYLTDGGERLDDSEYIVKPVESVPA